MRNNLDWVTIESQVVADEKVSSWCRCGATSTATCSLEIYAPYRHWRSDTAEYMHKEGSSEAEPDWDR